MSGDDAAGGRERGYTLVELVVVTLIFAIVTGLISVSFNRIVASSGGLIKTVETDIGGLVGLELLRVEMEYAGFGLPWSLPPSFSYTEARNYEHQVADLPGTDAANFNDAPMDPPRAYVTLNDGGFNGSDYLVLKGSALGMQEVGRKWSYLRYSSVTVAPKPPKSELELVPGKKDRVMVINTGVRNGARTRELVSDGSTFWFSFDKNEAIPEPFRPKSELDRYLVYGISPPVDSSDPSDVITFPFNRADYFLDQPANLSANCAPGTGALYRGMVSQKGNFPPAFPILDCVADFQVIFRMPANDGELADQEEIGGEALRALRQNLGLDASVTPAQALREMVKEVQVFILAQQGRIDRSYSYPYSDPAKAIKVGNRYWSETELASTFGPEWKHYRWKVYTIVVQPRNLN